MKFVRALYAREPARVVAGIAALVVFVAAKAGVVISEQEIVPALLIVLPIVLGGEAVRDNVIPVRKLATDAPPVADEVDQA
jgi:hypothetical protein